LKHYYYYDSQKCEFVSVTYSGRDKLIHTITTWLTIGLVVAGVLITTLANFSGSPSEIALKAENRELLRQFVQNNTDIDHLRNKVSSLAERDNEIYRAVLGIDPIPYDERQAGSGGADLYSHFDRYTASTSQLLRQTAFDLEVIERQINIQQISLEEIIEYHNANQKKMRHLPVMRPVNGAILSGYGMRMHPVYRVRRMHQGLDFRARVGTPVYAPGDGTIIFAANRIGGYGLTIDMDHGYGYVTRYAHLSGFADGIRSGTKVKRGDLIGYTGRTGRVSGPHLHYEILYEGNHVDPMNYLFVDLSPQEYRAFMRMSESTTFASE
jgi:murein DD-endopeptidase MepM/ murein hydrolase activator NlpD